MGAWDDALLERDDEIAALTTHARAAEAGRGRLVVVEGPAGIGKTRLLAEATALGEAMGFDVRRAQASPLERALRYGVVGQWLRDAGSGPDAEPAGPADPRRTHDDDAEYAVLDALLHTVAAAAGRAPLLLTADDGQWMDPASLRFLSYLARRLDGVRALVVVAHRPSGEPDDRAGLSRVLSSVQHARIVPRVLSADATASLLREALEAEPGAAFCAAAHAAAGGGNPQLVHGLARTLAARRLPPTTAALTPVADALLGRFLRARLAELGPAATRLAEAAAILPDGATLRQAAALAGLDDGDAARAAWWLQDAEILVPGAALTFANPRARTALLPTRLVLPGEGHLRAARVLADDGAPADVVAGVLLDAPARGDGRAVEALRAGARLAMAGGDPGGAARYLRRALAEPPPGGERPGVLLELAAAERAIHLDAAASRLEETLPTVGDPVVRARTLGQLAALEPSGDPQTAITLALRGLDELGDADVHLRREILAVVATATLVRDPTQQPPAVRAALRDAGRCDDAGARMLSAVAAYAAAWRNEPAGAVLALLDAAFRGDWLGPSTVGSGPFSFGVLALVATDAPSCGQIIDDWSQAARRRGHVAQVGGVLTFRARWSLAQGAVADALRDGQDALDALEAYGVHGAVNAYAAATLAEAALERDDVALAAQALARGGESAGSAGIVALEPARIRLHARSGETDAALQAWLELGARFTALDGACPALLPWRSRAALLAHELGATEQARELAADELAAATVWGTPRSLGVAATAVALVGAPEERVERLQAAAAHLATSPAQLDEARALIALGAALSDRGDRVAAREPLRRALELASACGATRLEQDARRALLATGARPRRAAMTGPEALTPAERRVAEAAADGATNREIAERLYLTPSTVGIHLSRSMRKLGLASRSQLADALAQR